MKKSILKANRMRTIQPFSPGLGDEDQEVVIEGEVIWVIEKEGLLSPQRAGSLGTPLLARVRTEEGTVEVRIFHPTDLHRRYLERGAEIRLIGRPRRRHGRCCFIHPRIILRKSQQGF